jgi:hypothetical protein
MEYMKQLTLKKRRTKINRIIMTRSLKKQTKNNMQRRKSCKGIRKTCHRKSYRRVMKGG